MLFRFKHRNIFPQISRDTAVFSFRDAVIDEIVGKIYSHLFDGETLFEFVISTCLFFTAECSEGEIDPKQVRAAFDVVAKEIFRNLIFETETRYNNLLE